MTSPRATRARPPLGQALRDVRRAMRMTQAAMAERLFVSRDVIGRWENGLASPLAANRAGLLAFARAAPGAGALRFALEHPEGVAEESTRVPDAKAHLDAALRHAAEELDVKARGLRAAVGAMLTAIEETGLTLAEARALLAAGSADQRPPLSKGAAL